MIHHRIVADYSHRLCTGVSFVKPQFAGSALNPVFLGFVCVLEFHFTCRVISTVICLV